MGRPKSVSYSDGTSIAYEWGKAGERTAVHYPDGSKAAYLYDQAGRLKEIKDEETQAAYSYDKHGRLSKKLYQNGAYTDYSYLPSGKLSSLSHFAASGSTIDSFQYQYDNTGNILGIQKERAGLPEETGSYAYGYDALGRLKTVAKDGNQLRAYTYDGYGNRIRMEEQAQITTYQYNERNQLLSMQQALPKAAGAEGTVLGVTQNFQYDKRGNLKSITENENTTHSYIFGAINRLEQAVGQTGAKAQYEYNALGHRIQKISTLHDGTTRQSSYLLDYTRQYHNLLMKQETVTDKEIERQTRQKYLWDSNVINIEENGEKSYYLQDHLGSPARILNGHGKEQACYGYDEFGQSLYESEFEQPFGYTGYQPDDIAGTYYAQAREYMSPIGCFLSKDKEQYQNPYHVQSMNLRTYCVNNPIKYVDPLGTDVYYFYDPNTFTTRNILDDAICDARLMAEYYNTDAHIIPFESTEDFIQNWNNMDEGKKEAVVLYSHSNNRLFYTKSEIQIDEEEIKSVKSKDKFHITDVSKLQPGNIETLIFLGCNTGVTLDENGNDSNNLASEFISKRNQLGIDKVIASDGSLTHKTITVEQEGKDIKYHAIESIKKESYHKDRDNDGVKLYEYIDNKLQWKPIGKKFNNILDLIQAGENACEE